MKKAKKHIKKIIPEIDIFFFVIILIYSIKITITGEIFVYLNTKLHLLFIFSITIIGILIFFRIKYKKIIFKKKYINNKKLYPEIISIILLTTGIFLTPISQNENEAVQRGMMNKEIIRLFEKKRDIYKKLNRFSREQKFYKNIPNNK